MCFSSCFSDSLDLHPETKQSDSKGRYCDYPVPFRDTGQRIDSEETGDWYSLFHRINELAAILSAQAEHEKQTREFLQGMISDVSHQLKTPLAALKMYDEIMVQELSLIHI